jgi:truncated hemoglobin YjbI
VEGALPTSPLYPLAQHFHSREALKEVVREFYVKQKADLMIGFFFDHADVETLAEGQTRFLCKVMGLHDQAFNHPLVAHKRLPPIRKGHFDRRLKLLGEVLEPLPEAVRLAWLDFERSFEPLLLQA